MKTYRFTVIVEGPDLQEPAAIDALYEAGLDDALAGVSDGIQYLDFDREAQSLESAIVSAVSAVERAVPGARVLRIAGAGLVSMADIAQRTGRSRESVRLLISGERGPGGFPPPVTDPRSRYRLWRWSDVARWFVAELGENLDQACDLIEAAVNAALEWRAIAERLSPEQRRSLSALAAP